MTPHCEDKGCPRYGQRLDKDGICKDKEYIYDLSTGMGGVKYYRYFAQGLRLHSKRSVREAIEHKFVVLRYDKITGKKTMFNHKSRRFEEVPE